VRNDGQAQTTLKLQASAEVPVQVEFVCVHLGQDVVSEPVTIRVRRVFINLVQSPPSVWLPSSGAVRVPLSPAPTLELRDSLGPGSSIVPTESATCQVYRNDSTDPTAALVEPPPGGYTGRNGTNVIALNLIMISAAHNSRVTLGVRCHRSEGDDAVDIYFTVTIADV
jgi:hypothetical protein